MRLREGQIVFWEEPKCRKKYIYDQLSKNCYVLVKHSNTKSIISHHGAREPWGGGGQWGNVPTQL